MRTIPALLSVAFLVLASCSRTSEETSAAAGAAKPAAPSPTAKPSAAASQPSRVKIARVLIAFQGLGLAKVTRTKEEAEKLAKEIYERAKKGADFDTLMKQSDDNQPGTYGIFQVDGADKPGDAPRSMMDPGVANVAFSLQVGQIGMCAYEPQKSPFGWNVIKRLE